MYECCLCDFENPYVGADCPFLSIDYYGTQESPGRMNLQTMQKSAEALYGYAVTRYPGKAVIVMGHSYGCGMAAYLAGVRSGIRHEKSGPAEAGFLREISYFSRKKS